MTRDIHDAFEQLTEPVHPGFRTQLRSRLEGGRPGQGANFSWLAPALAVIALVAAVGGVALLVGGPPGGTSVPSGPGPAISTPTSSSTNQPSADLTFGPSGTLPAFLCGGIRSGGEIPAVPVGVHNVRMGGESGFARFVLDFDGKVPTWQVSSQASTIFTEDASGRQVTLQGTQGLLIRVRGAGSQTGGWLQDIKGAGTIREARQLGNFEAVFSWGLGIQGDGCFRAFTLAGPDRLVVDVQSP